jgi:hypothetical protein
VWIKLKLCRGRLAQETVPFFPGQEERNKFPTEKGGECTSIGWGCLEANGTTVGSHEFLPDVGKLKVGVTIC